MTGRRFGVIAVAAACAVFAARFLQMIDRHAVNILFWDQWDFLAGLREGLGPWKLFSWLHGPHRMGLGYFFIAAVYRASAWDTRVETFAMAGIVFAALALALVLKARAVGPLTWLDVCVPALVLTRTQSDVFLVTPNAAHGPIPLLLAVAAPFCWLVGSHPLRALLGGLLAFAATYTGFAIVLVPCLAALFAVDALRSRGAERAWSAAAVALCIASLASFGVGYRLDPAAACYRLPDPQPLRYAPFAGIVLLRPMRLDHLVPVAVPLASAAFLAAVAAGLWAAWTVARRPPALLSRTVFLFVAFGLLFVANAAVGRVCFGLPAAFAMRYVPYVLPIWLAAYFLLARAVASRPRLRVPAAALAAALVFLQLRLRNDDLSMRFYSEGKARWRACYLATGDESGCNRSTGFRVYPAEGAPQVKQMLDYLRAHRLNLYKP